jgi:hypothetical protein
MKSVALQLKTMTKVTAGFISQKVRVWKTNIENRITSIIHTIAPKIQKMTILGTRNGRESRSHPCRLT